MFAVEMTDMSGWQQTRKEIRTPSSLQIAIVSGRICRYAGNLPCSLLTHVMVGARVVWRLLRETGAVKDMREQTFSWWMLHDAHEVITGDFASHKCDEMKAWQTQIDDTIACVYGIDRDVVDEVVIHSADMISRCLEAKHYGTSVYLEAFEQANTYDVPSPEMQRETIGIFRSDYGRLSCCITDENVIGIATTHPVGTYASILDLILRGDQRGAVEFYDGMVVELGL